MIEVKPLFQSDNIVVNQNKVPRQITSLVNFVVSFTLQTILKTKQEIDVNVSCVSESYIQKLNKKYRNKDKVTNVLSFPADALDEDIDAPRELGDIFLCLPYIVQEAKDQDINELDHLAHLLVHSCLHLVGYDHEDDRDFEKMQAKEIRLLGMLGVKNPYQKVVE